MIIAKEDIWEISIMVHPKRCLKKKLQGKEKRRLDCLLILLGRGDPTRTHDHPDPSRDALVN
mgnify:FL=1